MRKIYSNLLKGQKNYSRLLGKTSSPNLFSRLRRQQALAGKAMLLCVATAEAEADVMDAILPPRQLKPAPEGKNY